MVFLREILSKLMFCAIALVINHANAGNVYVLGDLTPIFDLTGRVLNHRVHSGNVQLFKNLRHESRDGASSVFILNRSVSHLVVGELDYFFTGVNDIVRIEEKLDGPVALEGVGLLVIITPSNTINESEVAAIKRHIKNSGDLLLIGDLAVEDQVNEYLNELLVELGSSVRIDLTKGTLEPFSFWFSDNSLVADVDSIKLGASRVVNGGNPLAFVLLNDKKESILSYEVLYQNENINAETSSNSLQ